MLKMNRTFLLYLFCGIFLAIVTGCGGGGGSGGSGGGQTPPDGQWSDAKELTDLAVDDKGTEKPHVAMNASGEAIVVWEQRDSGGKQKIFRAEYRDGAWTSPVQVSSSATGYSSATSARVAMDASGQAVIVWQQTVGGSKHVFRSDYRNGSWDPSPTRVSAGTGFIAAVSAQVAMDDNDQAIIVWQQGASGSEKIFRIDYRGGNWDSTPSKVSTATGSYAAVSAQVAMDDNDQAIIVWRQSDGSDKRILKAEYRNGSWPTILYPDDIVNDSLSGDAKDPQVAMAANGEAIIVWTQSDGDWSIYKSEYRKGSGSTYSWNRPGLGKFISKKDYDAVNARVAMDDGGQAVIVWDQLISNGDHKIYRFEYMDGSWPAAGEEDIVSPDGTDAEAPQVAMGDNGRAIIVWTQKDDAAGDHHVFRSQRLQGKWKDPADLSEYISLEGKEAGQGRVAMNSGGRAVVVWRQFEDSNNRIYCSEYR